MSKFTVDATSTKASEIIKTKLKECGGRVVVPTFDGSPCEIWVLPDGKRFMSDKLRSTKLYFDIFDDVVKFLFTQENYRAKKASSRKKGLKLGDPGCDETTLVGYIAKNSLGKSDGTAILDPIFVLAAVLDWAGIAHNERGYLSLTAEYRRKLS